MEARNFDEFRKMIRKAKEEGHEYQGLTIINGKVTAIFKDGLQIVRLM